MVNRTKVGDSTHKLSVPSTGDNQATFVEHREPTHISDRIDHGWIPFSLSRPSPSNAGGEIPNPPSWRRKTLLRVRTTYHPIRLQGQIEERNWPPGLTGHHCPSNRTNRVVCPYSRHTKEEFRKDTHTCAWICPSWTSTWNERGTLQ